MSTTDTQAPTAAEATAAAIRGYNHWNADAMAHLKAAFDADPDYPLAHLAKGLFLHTGRNHQYDGMVNAARETARAGRDALGERERKLLDALDALAAGELTRAVTIYEDILAAEPGDLLTQRLAQQELFWMGEARWMGDLVESTAAAWSPDSPDYAMLLSVRAFSLEEAGDRARAEAFGREAVERNASDPWGAHAVAHVLEMQGRVDDGVEWLEGLCGNWGQANQIKHHLWWHLCLFLLERGEHERVLELLDAEVRNPESPLIKSTPDVYIDLQNYASLMKRLELRGVDVGDRWASVAEVAAQRIDNHANGFTDAHAVMILAGAGELERAGALIDSMERFAASDAGTQGPRYRNAAIPASRAALAHRRGDHAGVVAALMPARRDLWQMGGSHAQRDIFTQLLTDSLRAVGDAARLQTVLREARAVPFEQLERRSFYREVLAAA